MSWLERHLGKVVAGWFMIAGLWILGALLILCIVGCTATTTITQPDGKTYEVVSQKDAVVHAKLSNSIAITVDNRGEGGIMSDIIKMWSLKFITEDDK